MKKLQEQGFSAIEAILLIVIVGIVGLAGRYVYSSNNSSNDPTKNNSPQKSQTTQATNEPAIAVKDFSNACASGGGLKICGEAVYKKDLDMKEIWMEYGTDKQNLNLASYHFPSSDAIDNESETKRMTIWIQNADITKSTKYYYRYVGLLNDGNKVNSEVSSFTSVKE